MRYAIDISEKDVGIVALMDENTRKVSSFYDAQYMAQKIEEAVLAERERIAQLIASDEDEYCRFPDWECGDDCIDCARKFLTPKEEKVETETDIQP